MGLLELRCESWGPPGPHLPLYSWRASGSLDARSSLIINGRRRPLGQPWSWRGSSARVPRVRATHTGGPPRLHLTRGSHRWAAPSSPDPGLSRHQSSGGDFPARAENRGDVREDPVSDRSERASPRVLCQPGTERLLGSPPLPNAPACPQGLRTAGEGQVSAELCWPGLRMAWSWPLGRGGGQQGGL